MGRAVRVAALAVAGFLAIGLGGLLVVKAIHTLAGSPVGWALIALGIICLFVALGVATGVYQD